MRHHLAILTLVAGGPVFPDLALTVGIAADDDGTPGNRANRGLLRSAGAELP